MGNAKSAFEAITGKDLVTGQELSVYDRVGATVGIFTGGLGKGILKGAKLGLGIAGNSLDANKALKPIDRNANVNTKGTGNALDGVRIINKKYAGEVYNLSGDLGKKYPEGVKFSKEGFPDFSPYSKAKLEIEGLIGNHYYDFKKANEVLGLKNTPAGYT